MEGGRSLSFGGGEWDRDAASGSGSGDVASDESLRGTGGGGFSGWLFSILVGDVSAEAELLAREMAAESAREEDRVRRLALIERETEALDPIVFTR